MITNEGTLTGNNKIRRNGLFLQDPETLVWEKAEKNPETGTWEKTGLFFYHAAEIKADRCFRAQTVNQRIKAHTLVLCYPETVRHEETVPGERAYFMDVMELGKENAKRFPCPTDLLEFSPSFKAKLIEHKHLPKKAFEKQSLLDHIDREIPETTDDVVSEIADEGIDNYLNCCHPRRLVKIGERIICKDQTKNKKPAKKNHEAKK